MLCGGECVFTHVRNSVWLASSCCGKCILHIYACCGIEIIVQWCSGKCNVGAVLVFSCGETLLFASIRGGAVWTFSCGETSMFTYMRGCAGLCGVGILVDTVSASDSRSESWELKSPCAHISDVRI